MGLSDRALKYIWPGNAKLEEKICLLKRLGVLEIGVPRHTINPLLTKFVTKTNFQHCDRTLMQELCSFYEIELFEQVLNCEAIFDEATLKAA